MIVITAVIMAIRIAKMSIIIIRIVRGCRKIRLLGLGICELRVYRFRAQYSLRLSSCEVWGFRVYGVPS